MSFLHILKTALARRLAFVVVAFAFGWFGFGTANAQSSGCTQNGSNYYCSTASEAQTVIQANAVSACAKTFSSMCKSFEGFQYTPRLNDPPYVGEFQGKVKVDFGGGDIQIRLFLRSFFMGDLCPSGTSWDSNTSSCSCPSGQIKNASTGKCMDKCSTRPDQTLNYGFAIPNGSIRCDGGCLAAVYQQSDGSYISTFLGDSSYDHCNVVPDNCDSSPGYTMNYGLSMCIPPIEECAPNEIKDPVTGVCRQGCPAGMVMGDGGLCKPESNTCPAGQVKGPDGSCIKDDDSCPAGQVMVSDGTCKKGSDPDKDGGDDDKYFSGGDSCSSPPSCSGDPILCGQAHIQWRIDCNTRRNAQVSGGSCDAVPSCTGEKCDALQFAGLIQQWRTACYLDKIANGSKGGNDNEGQPDWTKVDGMNQDGGQGESPNDEPRIDSVTLDVSDIDSSGWLGGFGSCPSIVSMGSSSGIAGSFSQALSSPPAYFCNFIGMMAALVMLGASFVSALILARG